MQQPLITPSYLRQATFEEQRDLLFLLGYFFPDVDDWSEESRRNVELYAPSSDSTTFQKAVRKYQEFHSGLPKLYRDGWRPNNTIKVDGIFGPETKRILETRFCGCADIMPSSTRTRQWDFSQFPDGLRVLQDMEFSGIPPKTIKSIWESALDEIRSYGQDIKFSPHSGGNIHAHSRRIDRTGGVLAWSYLPGYGSGPATSLEQRYDTSERWAGREDTFLRPVVIHELLHAFGLDHTNNPRSIMYPSMNGVQHMTNWEIKEIQKRYGVRSDPEPDPPSEDIEIRNGQFQVVIDKDKVIRCQVILDKNTPV